LLGDYNRLRPDDGRVKEITQLGLTYNLLTAYTSFVAIDTQVRGKNGQAVTVKQPLPLPEGVSDLAVGEGSVLMKASRACAPALALTGCVSADQSLSKMEGLKEKGAGREEDKKNGKPSSGTPQVRLGELVVTGGLAKEKVQEILQKELSSFQLCFQEALKAQPNLKGKMVMKFTIDARGRVTQVKVSETDLKAKGKELQECVRQRLLSLQFLVPAGGVQVTVTVPFLLN
jgi:Ca-activated chloride channel family protein